MENQIFIVSFSGKYGGNCDKIADFIANQLKKPKCFLFSGRQIQPCGQCDYICFRQPDQCPHFMDPEYALLEQICQSRQVYFVVPNYCDYPCANFFIFNERSQIFFQGRPDRLERYLQIPKKFIVISGSNQSHFTEVFSYHVTHQPEILFLSAKEFGKRSIDGDILDSKEARNRILQFLESKRPDEVPGIKPECPKPVQP